MLANSNVFFMADILFGEIISYFCHWERKQVLLYDPNGTLLLITYLAYCHDLMTAGEDSTCRRKKIERIRTIRGMKQETLAVLLNVTVKVRYREWSRANILRKKNYSP